MKNLTLNTDGILLVDKPADWSSHDVVAKARRYLGTRKVGHAGTLDPMATGLLILGVNRGTKLLHYLITENKSYDATLRLGSSTTTDDAQGEVVEVSNASHLTDEQIHAEIEKLTGNILQVPTAVSAIKINGERAYHKVRKGEEVKLKARPVTIFDFEVHSIDRQKEFVDVNASVTCSSGTYIRALARDMGQQLGVGGHLTSLRRTAIGTFNVDDAVTLETLKSTAPLISLADVVKEMFPAREVTAEEAEDITHGRRIAADDHRGLYGAWCQGELVALMENKAKVAKSQLMVKI
ncbi:MAG: tRNA pseudouridine(55) synthase TruB [Micrococcaceae bacterium]